MRYCKRCVLPDTRPNLILDQEGICNACRSHESRPIINWALREIEFQKIISDAKIRSSGYDCLIPVSGGKDSTWQVVTCLEHGLNPLCVTWCPPLRTEIGQRNLDNLIRLGVDHIDYRINPEVEKKFTLAAFKKFGIPAIPMHMALFNIPLSIAVKFQIPLVIYGENSAVEYGGNSNFDNSFLITRSWLNTYGVMHGTGAADWVSDLLSKKELAAYFGPNDEELEIAGTKAIFLGQFFPWDPEISLRVALSHGFQVSQEGPKTGLYNYADIDDNLISVHHWLKWYKFGFTRLFDNLSLEIRNGRMSRDVAVGLIKEKGDQTPHSDITLFCKLTGITSEEFYFLAEKYRNTSIWKNFNGRWFIPEFIIPDWEWA